MYIKHYIDNLKKRNIPFTKTIFYECDSNIPCLTIVTAHHFVSFKNGYAKQIWNDYTM